MRFIPLAPGSKRPVLKSCQYRDGWPAGGWVWDAVAAGYRIGLLPGPSGIVVVDVDVALRWYAAADGSRTALPTPVTGLQDLALAGYSLPPTCWERTPSGGWHLFYRQCLEWPVLRSKMRLAAMALDVKVTGLVACWPSDGYTRGDTEVLETLPRPLAELFQPVAEVTAAGPSGPWTEARVDGILARLREAPPGERNSILNWAAWKLREAVSEGVVTREEAEELLRSNAPAGLSDAEITSTVRSGLGR